MKKPWLCLALLVLLLTLAACGGEAAESAASPEPGAESAEEPASEPTPEPAPEPAPAPQIETEIRLCQDPLPEGLRLLSYAACVNSTKEAQTYIDTGIVPTNDTRFYLDFQCPTGFVVKDTWFFGCFDRDKHMYMEVGFHLSQGNEASFYTATGVHYSQYRDSTARTVAWIRPGDYVYRNISTGQVFREFKEPVEQHLFLFSRQHMDMQIAGTHDIQSQYELRIFCCRIWQDDRLLRDYLPCLCEETGRVGMYDLVEGRVSYSDGTEELLAGPVLPAEGSALALDGVIQGSVSVPRLQGFFFRGYYTGRNGEGEKVIDENGLPCAQVEPAAEITLYAFYERDEGVFERY